MDLEMGIREEFDQSLENELKENRIHYRVKKYDPKGDGNDVWEWHVESIALWSARWMAERCANLVDDEISMRVGDMIRQLAKELDGGV